MPVLWYLVHARHRRRQLAGASVQGIAYSVRSGTPSVRRAATFTGPVVMLVVVVLLAALYPALKAAWIQPVDAMHYR